MHAEHHSNCAENECVRSFCDFAICESSQIAKFRKNLHLEALLVDLQHSDLRLQGRSGHTESGGSSRLPGHPSFAFPEGRLNHLFLLRRKLLRQFEWTRRLQYVG